MEPVEIRSCTVAEMEHAPNLADLLAEYAIESAIPGMGPPKAQLETYRQLEAVGALHLFGAFQGDALVGFLVMIVSVLPHYGALVASTESYFVACKARKSGAGLKLLQEAENLARILGVAGFFVSAPIGGRLERVMSGKGYRETNRVFFRGLL